MKLANGVLAPRWALAAPADADLARRLADSLAIPEPLAALLVQRGITEAAGARRFLRPTLDQLTDPLGFRDMERAVDVIAAAVARRAPILVHGDYDVDGQCGSAMLTRVLREAGAIVHPFVPHRLRDGYDFGPAGLAEAERMGAGVIITCDCGITAVEAVRAARDAGRDVVVTDHHLPGPELPPATAVLDPRQSGCPSEEKDLCGAGVAFKLVQALVPRLGLPENLPYHFLDYVALATVADIVPLVGENRVLVRHGLKLLARSRWTGLRALVEAAGLAGKPLRTGHIGFILAPRVNAVGRIGDANDGLRLLLTDDPAEAADLARAMETLNARRQDMDQRILDEAIAQVEREIDLDRDYAIVLGSAEWHPGVIGIVASRLVERFGRPTILVAWEGEVGRGSGRSVAGFDLHEALQRVGPGRLEKYGGHAMAAGLTVHRERFDDFRVAFLDLSRELLTPDDLVPVQRVDLELPLADVSDGLERLVRHLEPFGPGNPTPVFGVRRARAVGVRRVGTNHLRFTLDDGSAILPAIGFQWADRMPPTWLERELDVAFQLEREDWHGQTNLQARVAALAPSTTTKGT